MSLLGTSFKFSNTKKKYIENKYFSQCRLYYYQIKVSPQCLSLCVTFQFNANRFMLRYPNLTLNNRWLIAQKQQLRFCICKQWEFILDCFNMWYKKYKSYISPCTAYLMFVLFLFIHNVARRLQQKFEHAKLFLFFLLKNEICAGFANRFSQVWSQSVIVLNMVITRDPLQPHNPVGFPCSAGFVNDLELIGRHPQAGLYQSDHE